MSDPALKCEDNAFSSKTTPQICVLLSKLPSIADLGWGESRCSRFPAKNVLNINYKSRVGPSNKKVSLARSDIYQKNCITLDRRGNHSVKDIWLDQEVEKCKPVWPDLRKFCHFGKCFLDLI